MVKTVGCKISDRLYHKITIEINILGKSKSQFIRMLIDNYFKDQNLDKDIQVNRLTTGVNQINKEDRYETAKEEIDKFFKDLNEDIN